MLLRSSYGGAAPPEGLAIPVAVSFLLVVGAKRIETTTTVFQKCKRLGLEVVKKLVGNLLLLLTALKILAGANQKGGGSYCWYET